MQHRKENGKDDLTKVQRECLFRGETRSKQFDLAYQHGYQSFKDHYEKAKNEGKLNYERFSRYDCGAEHKFLLAGWLADVEIPKKRFYDFLCIVTTDDFKWM
ncbi:CLUMA_CG021485, isoform A [Clunio marinus]|uniref:CLUMA_CG021485, isoform A n=1 Tax=Clunio marinus TaxID=568069 RepID=A0A1J1J7U3_9DIPT|nr:CLUMA_CG021485, isoform A [Clunio marinus]